MYAHSGERCWYSWMVISMFFLSPLPTRFLSIQTEVAHFLSFLVCVSSQDLGAMLCSVTLSTAAAAAAEKLRLWNSSKNKSELYSYQTDISLLSVFCPEQESLCSDLQWTECSWDSRGPPHPSITLGCFPPHQIWIYMGIWAAGLVGALSDNSWIKDRSVEESWMSLNSKSISISVSFSRKDT